MAKASIKQLATFMTYEGHTGMGWTPAKWNLSDSGINAKYGTISYNVSGNRFDDNGVKKTVSGLVDLAFDYYEEVTGITFEKITGHNADINFSDEWAWAEGSEDRAFWNAASSDWENWYDDTEILDYGQINIGANWLSKNGKDFTYFTILHEIGHALGLSHTGLYNNGSNGHSANCACPTCSISAENSQNSFEKYFDNDGWQLSAMSYHSQTKGYSKLLVETPMVADFHAIDLLYTDQSYNGKTFGTTMPSLVIQHMGLTHPIVTH